MDEEKNTEELNKTEIINEQSKVPFFENGVNNIDIAIIKKTEKMLLLENI